VFDAPAYTNVNSLTFLQAVVDTLSSALGVDFGFVNIYIVSTTTYAGPSFAAASRRKLFTTDYTVVVFSVTVSVPSLASSADPSSVVANALFTAANNGVFASTLNEDAFYNGANSGLQSAIVAPNSMTYPSPNAAAAAVTSSLGAGEIAAAVIFSVIGCALLLFLIFWCSTRKGAEEEDDGANNETVNPVSAPSVQVEKL